MIRSRKHSGTSHTHEAAPDGGGFPLRYPAQTLYLSSSYPPAPGPVIRTTLTACAVLALLVLAGCSAPGDLENGGGGDGRLAPRPGFYESEGGLSRFVLARTAEDVKTIQIHQSGDETSLPIVVLNSGQTLTLQFDVLDEGIGRPLSVYFYHADRTWRRDLIPSEYLRSFLSDDIRDYRTSSATEVRYVHYQYDFPNTNIDFLISGNYIVRVTERGDESAVLFERAFFINEDAAQLQFSFQSGFSQNGSVLQPVVQFRPGPTLQDAPVFDYTVCFSRNGRFALLRCAPEPTLVELALYQFYLPRESAFEASEPLFEVDLGQLQVGAQIASVDRSVSPYRATLDFDYARFGSEYVAGALTGQPIIASAFLDVGEATTQAEYVETTFRFVPDGDGPERGPVIVSGSFNDWQIDPANTMTWNAETSRYEVTLLLKQGRYLYRYYIDDPARARPVRDFQPSLYTAFVYLNDPFRQTDRLVETRSAFAE